MGGLRELALSRHRALHTLAVLAPRGAYGSANTQALLSPKHLGERVIAGLLCSASVSTVLLDKTACLCMACSANMALGGCWKQQALTILVWNLLSGGNAAI